MTIRDSGQGGDEAVKRRIREAAERALAEAAERRRAKQEPPEKPREIDGPGGPEPGRYGDWEVKGRASDF